MAASIDTMKRKNRSSSNPSPPNPPAPSPNPALPNPLIPLPKRTHPKSSMTTSPRVIRDLAKQVNAAPPAFNFDGSDSIEAGQLNNFNLSATIEAAIVRAENDNYIMEPEEKDPNVFDFTHIAHALNLPPTKPPTNDSETRLSKRSGRKKRAKSDLKKQENHRKLKRRGGRGREGGNAPEEKAQLRRQLIKKVQESEIFKQSGFSMLQDASVAGPGWCGRRMPAKELRQWKGNYKNGKIKEIVAEFTPVRFTGCAYPLFSKNLFFVAHALPSLPGSLL